MITRAERSRIRLPLLVLALFLLGSCPLVAAMQEPPELLVDVDQKESAKFTKQFHYFFKQKVYFAKPGRYRIVKVNFDLLEQNVDSLTITPFPNEQTHVSRISTYRVSSTDALNWRGSVEGREKITIGFTGEGRSATAAELLPLNLVELNLMEGSFPVPPLLEQELRTTGAAGASVMAIGSSTAASSGGGLTMMMRAKYVSGRWYSSKLRSHLIITPISDDPRYHLVYEEDASKRYMGRPSDFERAQAFNEYTKKLDDERKVEEEKLKGKK